MRWGDNSNSRDASEYGREYFIVDDVEGGSILFTRKQLKEFRDCLDANVKLEPKQYAIVNHGRRLRVTPVFSGVQLQIHPGSYRIPSADVKSMVRILDEWLSTTKAAWHSE